MLLPCRAGHTLGGRAVHRHGKHAATAAQPAGPALAAQGLPRELQIGKRHPWAGLLVQQAWRWGSSTAEVGQFNVMPGTSAQGGLLSTLSGCAGAADVSAGHAEDAFAFLGALCKAPVVNQLAAAVAGHDPGAAEELPATPPSPSFAQASPQARRIFSVWPCTQLDTAHAALTRHGARCKGQRIQIPGASCSLRSCVPRGPRLLCKDHLPEGTGQPVVRMKLLACCLLCPRPAPEMLGCAGPAGA